MTDKKRLGRPRKLNPCTARVTVNVTADQKRRLERLAARRGVNVADVMRLQVEGLVGPPIP